MTKWSERQKEALEYRQEEAFDPFREAGVGILIAPGCRNAFTVMRQPILVPVDSHEILQVQRYADLLVSLHLGEIDEHISVENSLADQILMSVAVMMQRDLAHVVFAAIQARIRVADRIKFRGSTKVDSRIPSGVTWERPVAHDHAVDLSRVFRAEIDHIDLNRGMGSIEGLYERQA